MSVRRRLPPLLLALVLGLLAAFAVACGDGGDDSNLIGPRGADRIRAALDDIDDRVARGRCEGLSGDLAELDDAIASLPSSVDRRLRRRLGDGADLLRSQARDDCDDNQPETTTTETTPETVPPPTTETVPPETTPTAPPETTTVPPETEPVPPETTPEEPVLPEDTGGTPGAAVPPGQAKKDDG
jgi:hypothetical protein